MMEQSGKRLSLAILLALAAVAAWLIYLLIRPFLDPILFAVVLAIAFQPLYRLILRRARRPALAALLTTLVLLVAVLAPLGMLGVTIAHEARDSYTRLAGQSAQEGGWSTYLGNMLEPPVQWIAARTGMPAPDVRAALLERAQSLSAGLVSWGGSLLGNLTSTLWNAVLSLFVLFFLFLEGDSVRAGILRWLPLEAGRTEELLRTVSDSIIANVYGMAAVGLAQGLLTGLAFWFTGLSSPVLWGSIAAICSLVPIVGTALVWAPGALILLLHGAWGKALFLVLWGVLVVSMADNIIRPLVLSGRTEMNTLIVFFALMGGMQAFGFIGIFAGPVIFAVAIAIFRILREEYIGETGGEPGG